MPRKTLFKPQKQINLGKDPLWREIFIDTANGVDSDADSDEENMVTMYKRVCATKGIKIDKQVLA